MDKMHIKEVKSFNEKISKVKYDRERFKIYVEENKFIMGMFSGDEGDLIGEVIKYKTLYETIMDLDWKIKLSFTEGMKYAYTDKVQKEFNFFKESSLEEDLAYYNIENAIFRISTLWDMLAQLYCLHFEVNIANDKIYYKQIFKPDKKFSIKFREQAIKINEYLNEEDDSDKAEWKGSHRVIGNMRNKMTHRNAPNVTTMSDYDFNIRSHPVVILKRCIDDYEVVSGYLKEILDLIENEIM